MKTIKLFLISYMLFSLAISGCAASLVEGSPDPGPQPQSSEQPLDAPSPTPAPGTIASKQPDTAGAVPEEMIEKAKNDLMERLGVTAGQIVLREATAVDWPDTSLGCPQPGMAYAEVITPGYWIVLEAEGMPYPYHTDLESQVVLCQEDSLPSFPVTPGEIDDGQPWMPVD